ncbi:hypothetical protein JOD20_004941 [Herpetosiphon giganteus]|nr:hypothetical protein [Herpetosiphon giganteus]
MTEALVMYGILFLIVPAALAPIYISLYKSMRRHSRRPGASETSRWATGYLSNIANIVVQSPIGGILIIDAIFSSMVTIFFYPDTWGWILSISLAICCVVSVTD